MTSTDHASTYWLFSDTMATAVLLFALDPLLDQVDALAACAQSGHDENRHQAREKLVQWRAQINSARDTLQPYLHRMQQALYAYLQKLDEEPNLEPKLSLASKPRSNNSEMLLESVRLFDDYCLAYALLDEQGIIAQHADFDECDVQTQISGLLKGLYRLILDSDPSDQRS